MKQDLMHKDVHDVNITPEERRNCLLYTSGPNGAGKTTVFNLLTKVPPWVIRGKSPMKISCSLISPVSLLCRRTLTLSLIHI